MSVKPQTLSQLRTYTAQQLRAVEVAEPDLETRWFLSRILNISEVALWTEGDTAIAPEIIEKVEDFVRRRGTGEPFAYIVGSKDFYGREFLVNQHTLIPRPETEQIVQRAIYHALRLRDEIKIADFGTGSGCIGLSLLCEIPETKLTAIDISAEALEVANKNALQLNVQDRVQFICSDVMEADLQGTFDIVVANPPYIDAKDLEIEENVKKFEPAGALFAEDEGFNCIEGWTQKAAQVLKPGGLFLCEIGAKQADRVTKFAEDLKVFSSVDILKDLAHKPRILRAVKVQ